MNVLIISKYENIGGAAIASKRLLDALLKKGLTVEMLVDIKQSNDKHVHEFSNNKLKKHYSNFLKYLEKLMFLKYELNKTERFSFSTLQFGKKVHKHKLIEKADIIHIHWINHSFISSKSLKFIFNLNKPIVITMHDMWYATGGCHHARECDNYTSQCGNCQFLKKPFNSDISNTQNILKDNLYTDNLTFITCSNWLYNKAKESLLLTSNKIVEIANPIDIELFKPINKKKAKLSLGLNPNKKYILFISANTENKRKGISYLVKALNLMNSKEESGFEALILGKTKNKQFDINLPFTSIGYVSDVNKIINIYNAADVYVTPSLEDNLPNTIMESMACGTPCVGFEIGGIPEMIDHKINGYISKYKDEKDLVDGINYCIKNLDCGDKARKKVVDTYSEKTISRKIIALYNSLLHVNN